YDVKTAAEFGQAVAIARGTPQNPLVNPEDLLDAKIVDATPQAKKLGIEIGMPGRQAVELLLAASPSGLEGHRHRPVTQPCFALAASLRATLPSSARRDTASAERTISVHRLHRCYTGSLQPVFFGLSALLL